MALSIMSVACENNVNTFSLHGKGWTEERKQLAQAAMDIWCEESEGKFCAKIGDDGESGLWFDDSYSKSVFE